MDRPSTGAGDSFDYGTDGSERVASPADACPTEDELATLLEHGLASGSRFEAHVARCATCRGVIATAASTRGAMEPSATSSLAPTLSPMARRAPVSGERVGRYVIVERIGAGAMGDVYVADDPDLERRVAVKILRGEAEDGESSAALVFVAKRRRWRASPIRTWW